MISIVVMQGYLHYFLYFSMGAIRMHFQIGRDDWEYGLVTINAQRKIFLEATSAGDQECISYFHLKDHISLFEALNAGDVHLDYSQTLGFIRATDYIARMLIDSTEERDGLLFGFISEISSRFKTPEDFEKYYLGYSTHVLEVVNREFDKEPALRGKLKAFLFN